MKNNLDSVAKSGSASLARIIARTHLESLTENYSYLTTIPFILGIADPGQTMETLNRSLVALRDHTDYLKVELKRHKDIHHKGRFVKTCADCEEWKEMITQDIVALTKALVKKKQSLLVQQAKESIRHENGRRRKPKAGKHKQ